MRAPVGTAAPPRGRAAPGATDRHQDGAWDDGTERAVLRRQPRHPPAPNALYYGDNLNILRHHIGAETVDLVYLDPPFNSKRDYNVLFREKSGEASPAQIEAFTDTWAGAAPPSGPTTR